MPRSHDAVVRAREPTVLDLTLARPGTIHGLVCDPVSDASLEGVEVLLRHPDGSTQRSLTGPHGSFQFDNLRAANYVIEVVAPIGYVAPASRQEVVLVPNGNVEADFELMPGGIVRGRVLDEHSGEPLPDVPVVLLDSQGNALRRARTTAGGEYEFVNLPEDRYRVAIDDAATPEGA